MNPETLDLIRRVWPRQAGFVVALAMLLFLPAGSLRFWQGWLFAGVFIACTLAIGLYFVSTDPALVRRRLEAGPAAEKRPAQRTAMTILSLCLALLLIVPGFDFRWHWSAVPVWLVLAGNAGIVLSFVVFFVVMKQNSYAAATVRVEAGQPVISTGLYGLVRHPMYSGALVLVAAMPLALGSYWALLVVPPAIAALAWRTIDEERLLAHDLPGYAAYCARVGYRLIPGLW